MRACCRIRVHSQDIQATGEALPSAAGECQTAGARVAPAVETFATHQASPAEAQVQVAVQAQVQVAVAVAVQAQMETAAAVAVAVKT